MAPFRYQPLDVPCLAWCAHVPGDGSEVVVYHGPSVECRRDFFFEGAWHGEFAAGAFPSAETCMGSGGMHSDSGVVFATPTHTLERLQYVRLEDRLIVSNSLVFLLVHAKDTLDPGYPFYVRDLMTYVKGLKRHRRTIPTRRGNRVQILYHCNLQVRAGWKLKKLPKAIRGPFSDFDDYVAYLQDEVAGVAANAADPSRRTAYPPLTTLSSGYDSPACAVLARKIGCTRALTFPHARSELKEFKNYDDSGTPIGKILGLHVSEHNRLGYLDREDFPEAEFLAYGTGGGEVYMSSAEELLRGKLVFTGFHGDKVWDRVNHVVRKDILRDDPSGSSLSEFRLRTGFINLAVPFIGCLLHPSIHAISNSPEMKPWSVDRYYDRPICRRLLEQAGVPRELFGWEKKAVSQPFNPARGRPWHASRPLETIMTKASHKEFRQYLARAPYAPSLLERVHFGVKRRLFHVRPWLPWRVKNFLRRYGLDLLKAGLVQDERYEFPITEHDYTFHWAVDLLIGRYPPGQDAKTGEAHESPDSIP